MDIRAMEDNIKNTKRADIKQSERDSADRV